MTSTDLLSADKIQQDSTQVFLQEEDIQMFLD